MPDVHTGEPQHETTYDSLDETIRVTSDENSTQEASDSPTAITTGSIELFSAPHFETQDTNIETFVQEVQAEQDNEGRIVLGLQTEQPENTADELETAASNPTPITTLEQLDHMLQLLDQIVLRLESPQEVSDVLAPFDSISQDSASVGETSVTAKVDGIDVLIQQLDIQKDGELPQFVLLVSEDILKLVESARELVEEDDTNEHGSRRYITLSTGDREITIDIEILRKLIQMQSRGRRSVGTISIPIEVEDMTAWEEKNWQTISYQYWDEDAALLWTRLMVIYALAFIPNRQLRNLDASIYLTFAYKVS